MHDNGGDLDVRREAARVTSMTQDRSAVSCDGCCILGLACCYGGRRTFAFGYISCSLIAPVGYSRAVTGVVDSGTTFHITNRLDIIASPRCIKGSMVSASDSQCTPPVVITCCRKIGHRSNRSRNKASQPNPAKSLQKNLPKIC